VAVYVALIGWPLVVIILFRRTSLPVALIWSLVAGFLLLPTDTGPDFPLLPRIDKNLIPSVAAALMAMVILRQNQGPSGRMGGPVPAPQITTLPGWLPRSYIVRALMLLLIGGAFMTVMLNGDLLNNGGRLRRGLKSYDAFSIILTTGVALLPMFLARKFLAHPDSHRILLVILAVAGGLYSLPILYEVRMSPRLNSMIYGFFAHDWRQHIRLGGWRPIVFLNHGLVVGLFLSSVVLAALAAFRTTQGRRRWYFIGAALWLFMVLILSKNLGVLLVTVVLAPVFLIFGVRAQLLAAAIIATVVLSFPILRSAGFVPITQMTNLAASINPVRAQSFQFRLDNENQLLSKAFERPGFGWGGWGRERVFDDTGRDLSTPDGYWIITVGQGGWVRYIGEFGLLAMPIILLAWRRRRYEISLATSALCLVLAANLVDLIPNSGLTPLTWLMAGALLGRLELQKIDTEAGPVPLEAIPVRTTRYARPPAAAGLSHTRQRQRHKPTGANI